MMALSLRISTAEPYILYPHIHKTNSDKYDETLVPNLSIIAKTFTETAQSGLVGAQDRQTAPQAQYLRRHSPHTDPSLKQNVIP